MNRIKVLVSQSNVGSIIAKDVINYFGITLVAENSVLNQYIKDRLIVLGILYVWIYSSVELKPEEKVRKSYSEVVLAIKQVLIELSSGGKLNYQKIYYLSELVYGCLDESVYVIKCINDIKNKDEYTYNHCVNVAFYSMLIAKWLNLSKEAIEEVIKAGLLHDIGKVLIPDEILNKKGKLTEQEFNIMKNHSAIGFNYIKDLKEISELTKEAVLSHHERVDGSGYPYALIGNHINLYARIIGIADVYDAMTQDRVYKKRVTSFDAFKLFKSWGIGIFDIEIVDVFLKNISVNYTGLNVILDNGESGEIVHVPPHDITKPIILNGSQFIDLSLSNKRILSMG